MLRFYLTNMNKFIAHLRLMRPANSITAIADILLGYAVSGSVIQFINFKEGWFLNPVLSHLGWLVVSCRGL
jgi:4-hydroxybenzoate polyprenyltransferase